MMMTKWVKRSVLGKGSFGTVSLAAPVTCDHPFNPAHEAVLPSDDDQVVVVVAVKSADVGSATSLRMEGRFLHELRSCPEIVGCFGEDISVENGKETYNLLLEYAPGGTLEDLINGSTAHGGLPEIDVSCYAYMILKGLSYIHKRGYVHCDLKPANILVFPTMFSDVNIIKIADFGLAKKTGPLHAHKRVGDHVKKLRDNVRGTALYNSPESVLLGQHEAPMDIWALGVVMIQMLTGGKSGYWKYQNKDDLVRQIAMEEDLPEVPDRYCISEEAREFVLMCLIRDPKQRWTADKLLQHPFIASSLFTLHDALGPEQLVSPTANPFGVAADDKWFSGRSLFTAPSVLPSPTRPKQLCYLPHQMFEAIEAAPPAASPTRPNQFSYFSHQMFEAMGRAAPPVLPAASPARPKDQFSYFSHQMFEAIGAAPLHAV